MTIISIMYLFFVQLIFLLIISTAYSMDGTETESGLSNLEHLKDFSNDVSESAVQLLIKTGKGKFINFKFNPTEEQTLANRNLPVWTADEYDAENVTVKENQFNITEAVGNFRTYHDVEKNSAIVYFEKTQTFYGSIGSKYFIMGLPLNLTNEPHSVGGRYVKKRAGSTHKTTEHIVPSPTETRHFFHHLKKRNIDSEQNNDSNIQKDRNMKTEKHYIETLVFVTYDITQHYKNTDPSSYLTRLVMDQIVYFNAVDMMYAKFRLHDIKIHINLAGMIIENAPEVFNSMMAYQYLEYYPNGTYLIPEDSIHNAFRRYLKQHHVPFTIDSLDLILVMSGRAMLADYDTMRGVTYPMNMYAMRQDKYPDEAIPLVAMRYKYHYDQYCETAYEIGYALKILHYSNINGNRKREVHCNGKKLKGNITCLPCADWSFKSIKQSRRFMRENPNRCFLLNYPRSLLHPEEAKSLLIPPNQQCRCYGYDYDESKIPADACAQPLLCNAIDSDGDRLVTTILPLDGTPCGTVSVCWRKECVHISFNSTKN